MFQPLLRPVLDAGSRARHTSRPVRLWGLTADADESRKGFLLNHLISEELPLDGGGGKAARISNSDPVTGQAGWYDVRVRLRPAAAHEADETAPQIQAAAPLPGVVRGVQNVVRFFAGKES